jgi:carbamoyltransferase
VAEAQSWGLRPIIVEFEKITGVPLVLNTSFNGPGEPIVESPDDAIECFLRTGVDALAVGPFLMTKEPKVSAATSRHL